METKRFIPRRGQIDHIEVQETERTRMVNGVATATKGKTYIVFVSTGGQFESSQSVPMFKFEGRDEKFLKAYKDLEITKATDGRTIITPETILDAKCPETLKTYLKEDGKFEGPDGAIYASYGEYLLEMGTRNAKNLKERKDGTMAVVKANVPVSDGIQEWVRQDKNGKPVMRANGQSVIIRNIDIAVVLSYDEEYETFLGGEGASPEDQVRAEINTLIDRNRLRLISVPTSNIEEADEEPRDKVEA